MGITLAFDFYVLATLRELQGMKETSTSDDVLVQNRTFPHGIFFPTAVPEVSPSILSGKF